MFVARRSTEGPSSDRSGMSSTEQYLAMPPRRGLENFSV
jgi:hypothetical protein